MRAITRLSLLVLLVLHACGDPTVPGVAGPPPTLVGQWSSVRPAPLVQVHLHLLPNGKVLSWGRVGDPRVWDLVTGAFTLVPAPSALFCAGHDFLPDGRLLVAGGHISDLHGLANTNVFDPVAGVWQAAPAMAAERWYPTNTTLPNGEVLTLAGTDETGAPVTVPEVWDGAGWRQLTGASIELPYYPRTFVAPDGRVFYAGEEQQSRYLDVTGTGTWTDGPLRQFGRRDYGSAVMYEPGKILYAGGGDPPTSTAEIIGFSNPKGAVYDAELWTPTTDRWTTLARNAVIRIYQQTSLLLPDGRVLNTGSGGAPSISAVDELNYELYSPPYLFKGVPASRK